MLSCLLYVKLSSVISVLVWASLRGGADTGVKPRLGVISGLIISREGRGSGEEVSCKTGHQLSSLLALRSPSPSLAVSRGTPPPRRNAGLVRERGGTRADTSPCPAHPLRQNKVFPPPLRSCRALGISLFLAIPILTK